MENGVTIISAGTITEIKSPQTESVACAPCRISQSQFRNRPVGIVELGDDVAVVDYVAILAGLA